MSTKCHCFSDWATPIVCTWTQDIPKIVWYSTHRFIRRASIHSTYTIYSTQTRIIGLKLRRDKYTFLTSSIIYLGHRIDIDGFILFQTRWMLFWTHLSPTLWLSWSLSWAYCLIMENSPLTCHQHCILFINPLKHLQNGDGRRRKEKLLI